MQIPLFFNLLRYLSIFSVLAPILVGVINYRTLNLTLRVLFFYLTFAAITDITSLILSFYNEQNFLIRNLYTFLECTFIVLIYYLKTDKLSYKKLLTYSYCAFLLIAILTMWVNRGFNRLDSVLNATEAFIVVTSGLFYFYFLMSDRDTSKMKESYFVWINSALIIYFGMVFFLFLFNEYLNKNGMKTYYSFQAFHLVNSIVYNILLAIGICKARRILES